ncbi:MAG TPA: UDP-N-acetylmuramate dehydrogenase [bacterium (Candidatus Stahlbacteria)]|nr:UDP-N-acetylmuramate dehydrogenase [Candidatus Stahlbacteria bacterium]
MRNGLRINGRKKKRVPATNLTSVRVGGPVRYLIDVYDLRSLRNLLAWAKKRGIAYRVIGSGTNLIFPDRGYDGLIIRLGGSFKRLWFKDQVIAGCGIVLKDLIERLIKRGYGGMEPLYGIPGTLGGGIKGNCGAFGVSISDFIDRIFILAPDGEEMMFDRKRIGFGYRRSRLLPSQIITFALLRLKKGGSITKARGYLKRRLEKIPEGWSAGCIFKNPEGKIAGRLIERCGLKDFQIGGARVSGRHANFIINDGTATSSDIIRLIRYVRQMVRRRFGITLELEVEVVR